jgi:hypothetical protein
MSTPAVSVVWYGSISRFSQSGYYLSLCLLVAVKGETVPEVLTYHDEDGKVNFANVVMVGLGHTVPHDSCIP